MKLTESLAKLLLEHERLAHHPSLWKDNTWKGIFYEHYNRIWEALNKLDKS